MIDREFLMQACDLDALPAVFPDAPRVVARVKDRPEDFVVEEVPAYLPCGEGSHLFLWIEKRDCAGADLLHRLAAALAIPSSDIGYAGTKDRRAVTRQWVSVPDSCETRVMAGLSLSGIRILGVSRHRNKLRLGHLRGNWFRILLRGADPARVPDLARTAAELERAGSFNFFGPQRFGRVSESLRLGLALLETGPDDDPRFRRTGRFERRMALSAVQSAVFNLVLRERFERGLVRRVLAGDILARTDSGALFVCEDPVTDQARADSGEVVITGPVPGHHSHPALGEAGEIEQSVLARAGLGPETFRRFAGLMRGARRAFTVRPSDLRVEADPDGIVLSFYLPKGAYASVLLREFVRGAPGADAKLQADEDLE